MKKNLLLLGLLCLAQCTPARFLEEEVRLEPSFSLQNFESILVVAQTQQAPLKVGFETALVNALRQRGQEAQAQSAIPSRSSAPAAGTGEEHSALHGANLANFAAVLVAELRADREEKPLVLGDSNSYYFPTGLESYWQYAQPGNWQLNQPEPGRSYSLQVAFYSLRPGPENGQMLWTGKYRLRDPRNLEGLLRLYAEEIVQTLSASGDNS